MICAVVERSPPPQSLPMEFFWSADEIDLPDNFVFARTSPATRIDSTGKLTFGPNNIQTYSNDFITGWTYVGEATATSAQTTGPFGKNDGWKLIANNNQSVIGVRSGGNNVIKGHRYLISIYAKKGNVNFLALRNLSAVGEDGNQNNVSVWFNLDTGAVGSSPYSGNHGYMEDAGNGWYRCWYYSDAPTNLSASYTYIDVYACDANGSTSITSGNYIYIHGFHMQAVTYENPPGMAYVETGVNPYYGPRVDYENGVAEFVIEKSRQNRLTYSEDLTNGAWSISGLGRSNNVTGLDGLTNKATTLTANTSANICILYQDISGASGTNAHSVYAKKGTSNFVFITIQGTVAENCIAAVFNLDAGTVTSTYEGATTGTVLDTQIEHIGNGVYRCSLVGSSNAANYFQVGISPSATPSYDSNGRPTSAGFAGTETIIVQKPQCEAGNFTSSYMPTFASAFTRAAETCYTADSGMTNGAGTIIVECVTPPVDQFGCILSVYDVDGGEISDIFKSNSSVGDVGHVPMVFDNSDGGGGAYDGDDGVDMNSGEAVRIAVRRKLDGILDDHRLAISVNGNAPITVGSFTPDTLTPTGISLSQRSGGGFPMDVRIRRIAFTTQTLSDADLQLASTQGIEFTWTPDLIPDMLLWFDADDASTIFFDGDFIYRWEDKSPNANHSENEVHNAHCPSLDPAVQNGKNGIIFDQSWPQYSPLDSTVDCHTTGYTCFTVLNKPATYYNCGIGGNAPGNPSTTITWQAGDGRIYFSVDNGWQACGNNPLPSGFHAVTTVYDPTPAAYLYCDGVSIPTTLHDSGWFGNRPNNYPFDIIGVMSATYSVAANATLCETILCQGVIGGCIRYMVEKYLKAKWGTP